MKVGTTAATPMTEGSYYELQGSWDRFWEAGPGSDEELKALLYLLNRVVLAVCLLHERKAPSGN